MVKVCKVKDQRGEMLYVFSEVNGTGKINQWQK